MANVIKTVYTYPLDGSTTDFTIPFEYLARKFVVVTLIGQDRKELTVVTDYRFATRTTISLTRAWGPADNYQQLEIRRYTSASERLVDFSDGSILRAMDLNVAQVQTLHVAEEARDLTADTIGVNNDGNLDARGRRIVNVADGIAPGDVITLGQVTRWNESALNSKNAAKVSETNSKSSEVASKDSEQAAAGSASRAESSETNAKDSENLAHDWAQKDENATVANGEYSSYHYSRKASASATAGANSAIAAKTSEDNAKTSEINAKTAADRAKVEADRLGNMNDFASLIANTDVINKRVDFGAHWVEPTETASPDNNKLSYRSRWEANATTRSSYGTLAAYRNTVDGGMVMNVSSDGGAPWAFYFVSDGTINAGRVLTRLPAGKDPGTYPNLMTSPLDISFGGKSSRLWANGDITENSGTSVFRQFDGAASLGSALQRFVIDVWLGTKGGIYSGNGSKHVNVPAGHVVCGYSTLWTQGDGTFIQDLWYRAIWKRLGSGNSYIIGQLE